LLSIAAITVMADDYSPSWELLQGPTKREPGLPWIYYDKSGILISGSLRRVWFKVDYAAHSAPDIHNPARFLARFQYHAAFDCSNGTEKVEQSKTDYENGDVESANLEGTNQWITLAPDDPSYVAMQTICAWKKHFWE